MKNDNVSPWAHFNIRCEVALREEAEASAKSQGQSLAEWIRRAMKEKLEREANRAASDPTLEERLKAYLDEQLAEALGRAGVNTREDVVVMPSTFSANPILVRKQKDGRLVLLESRDGDE